MSKMDPQTAVARYFHKYALEPTNHLARVAGICIYGAHTYKSPPTPRTLHEEFEPFRGPSLVAVGDVSNTASALQSVASELDTHAHVVVTPEQVNFSFHFLPEAAARLRADLSSHLYPSVDMKALTCTCAGRCECTWDTPGPLWKRAWSFRDNPFVIFASLSDDMIEPIERLLEMTGRAINYRERCRAWEPKNASSWAAEYEPFVLRKDDKIELDFAALGAYLRVPEGHYLDVLGESDAELVNSQWTYGRGAATLPAMIQSIQAFPAACLRDAGTRQACSWVLLRLDGSMGVLNTMPDKRGHGFAKMVVRCMLALQHVDMLRLQANAELQASLGPNAAQIIGALRPYCHIKLGNAASEQLFTSLGFAPVHSVSWLVSYVAAPRLRIHPLLSIEDRPEMCEQLIQLVNASYKQDDAFWVDQTRTDLSSVRTMSKEGVFLLAFKADTGDEERQGRPPISDAEWQLAVAPLPTGGGAMASNGSSHDFEAASGRGELIASLYLKNDTVASTASTTAEELTLHLGMLTVRPDHKHLGVARKLAVAALRYARDVAHARRVKCFVVSVKPWLLRFYQELGFKVVGSEPWPSALDHELKQPCFFHELCYNFSAVASDAAT
jgi:GNAT superfamily N-acetyltransferase